MKALAGYSREDILMMSLFSFLDKHRSPDYFGRMWQRVRGSLWDYGEEPMLELCMKSRRDLGRRRNLGKKSVNTLCDVLALYGLELETDYSHLLFPERELLKREIMEKLQPVIEKTIEDLVEKILARQLWQH